MVHEDTAFNPGTPAPDPIVSLQEFEAIWLEVQAAIIARSRLERTRSWRRRANVRSTRFRHMRRAPAGARP
jgi:hypothetical protein